MTRLLYLLTLAMVLLVGSRLPVKAALNPSIPLMVNTNTLKVSSVNVTNFWASNIVVLSTNVHYYVSNGIFYIDVSQLGTGSGGGGGLATNALVYNFIPDQFGVQNDTNIFLKNMMNITNIGIYSTLSFNDFQSNGNTITIGDNGEFQFNDNIHTNQWLVHDNLMQTFLNSNFFSTILISNRDVQAMITSNITSIAALNTGVSAISNGHRSLSNLFTTTKTDFLSVSNAHVAFSNSFVALQVDWLNVSNNYVGTSNLLNSLNINFGTVSNNFVAVSNAHRAESNAFVTTRTDFGTISNNFVSYSNTPSYKGTVLKPINFSGAGVVATTNTDTIDAVIAGGGVGSQTPWTSDIDAANKKLTNVNYLSIVYTNTGSNASSPALVITNSAPAVSNGQQIAAIELDGNGWKTTATAASQPVQWRMKNVPVQGSANPSGLFVWESIINGGSPTTNMTLTSAGALTTPGAMIGQSFFASGGNTATYGGNSVTPGGVDFTIRSALFNAGRLDMLGNINVSTNIIVTNNLTVKQGALIIGPSGGSITNVLTGSATLDFPSTLTQADSDLTITVTGAVSGDVVSLGIPAGSTLSGSLYSAWVSAADTVTVRFSNISLTSKDPASGTFKVIVTKF